jgi:4-nitrophenyl phosphatase
MPGLAEFFQFLRQRKIHFACATNNASMGSDRLAERLQGWGADVRPEEIVTSSIATADYLETILPRGAPVCHWHGRAALCWKRRALSGEEDVAAVVVGIDWNVTYNHFKRAALNIRAGAKFIGTNGDRTFPNPEGIVPGNGALLALIETATDVKPFIIGKPSPTLYQMALKHLGADPERTLVLGDRLETDILGAVLLGLKSALVMSGVTTREQLAASDYQPDWVFDDITDLKNHWDTD